MSRIFLAPQRFGWRRARLPEWGVRARLRRTETQVEYLTDEVTDLRATFRMVSAITAPASRADTADRCSRR